MKHGVRYRIHNNFQMTIFKKSAIKDFENKIFESEAVIQLAIICQSVISKFYF